MVGIKDFFKPKNAPAQANHEKIVEDKVEDPLSQKLSRSKKTLVASKNTRQSTTASPPSLPSLKRATPIIIDDDFEDSSKTVSKEPSPRKVKAQSPSPRKVKAQSPSPRKSKTQSPSKSTLPKEEPVSKKFKIQSPPKQNKEKSVSPKKQTEQVINVSSSPVKAAQNTEEEKKSFNYRDYLQKRAAGPSAPGSKEIPVGAPNCLVGLAFVFTGELESLSREDAQDLVKRYGGRVTTAPSGKTSYVVVGECAGESKLAKIKALGIKTLDEDGLLDLIRMTKTNADDTTMEIDDIVKIDTLSLSSSQKAEKSIQKSKVVISAIVGESKNGAPSSELWTDKYAPTSEEELIGNHSNYEKLVGWLKSWTSDKSNDEKAVLISGPPGIGKTTSAHLACKNNDFEIVEMNASDTRSKSTLHEHVKDILDNRCIVGFSNFFAKENKKSMTHQYRKQVLIMDEVDGMSSGDRGGMAELIQLIKKSKIPIICICNDRSSPKVRSLANYCLDLRFRRPDARMIAPRIKMIAEREGLGLGVNAVEELVTFTHGDIRQVINILSTYNLTERNLDYDDSKAIGGRASKDVEMGPFDAAPALLGNGYDRMSLGERIDMYFVDSSLVPLMIQENYLKCKPNSPRVINGQSGGQSFIEIYAAAADSISEADLVDGLIRGANQEWSLAPLHAVMSSVRPAYYCHGAVGGRIDFPSWLGNNSKGTKNSRLLSELARHTFLHTTCNRTALRLYYLPVFASKLLMPLLGENVDETINFMDTYSLCREDFDSILELMIEPSLTMAAYAKVPTAMKTAFTRKYNQGVHKLPYAIGGTAFATVSKKILSDFDMPRGGLADDAVDDDTILTAGDNSDDGDASESDDISKDKMIKAKVTTSNAKKSTLASRGRGGSRGGGRGRGK